MRAVSGGTDTHLALVDLRPIGVTGDQAETRCDAARITLNKNAIPYDPAPPLKPSGLRVGSPSVTTQGMTEADMAEVGDAAGARGQGRARHAGRRRRAGRAWPTRCPPLVARAPAYPRAADRTGCAVARSRTLVLPIREYLLAGLTATVVTFLLIGPVRVLALRLGAVAWPRGRDVHVTPTPRWGGLAMLGGVLAGVVLAYQLPALRLAFDYSDEVVGALVAAVVLGVVGALDDRYELDALTKLAGQTTAAGVLVLVGVQWVTFWVPWGGGGPGISGSFLILGETQGVLLTVLLTVALVNAMNFVDGLDGLAAGIGLIAAAATVGLFAIGLVRAIGNDPSAYSPGAARGRAGRRVPGLPAAQLQPGPDLHGRLRLDAHRPAARRGHHERVRAGSPDRRHGRDATSSRCSRR